MSAAIDRTKFFPLARDSVFGGTMTQPQVDGTNTILNAWETKGTSNDPRWLANVLAQAKWESAGTMQPVREAFYLGEPEPAETYRKRLRYYPYYGRGVIQLTWDYNYRKFGNLLGIDLISKPELALEPMTSATILLLGMENGLFTGVGLGKFFGYNLNDPLHAREIVNGLDKAYEVEQLHIQFLAAVQASWPSS